MCYSVAHQEELARVNVILWEALGLRDQPWEGACGVKVTESKSLCRKHTAANFPRGHWFPLTTKLSGPVRFRISTETMSFTVQWCAEVT